MKKFAVVLAGCGRKDGSEINEAITLLLSLEQHHCEYQCFAPNRPQTEVIDHMTDKKVCNAKRNILVEAARLARGRVLPIEVYKAEDFDGLLFSGGYGVAKNLCDYVLETHKAHKPIGAMCIAPVMMAKLIPDVCVTLGTEGTLDTDNIRKMGAQHVQTEHGDVCADNTNLVYTTPAYMLDATLKDVYDGAFNLVETILDQCE